MLLVIRKLLYVGNLHLPTFIYIQNFDRIFHNDFRNFSLWFAGIPTVGMLSYPKEKLNFSRWFLQEVTVISSRSCRDFCNFSRWFLGESAVISEGSAKIMKVSVVIFGQILRFVLIFAVQKFCKNGIFVTFSLCETFWQTPF